MSEGFINLYKEPGITSHDAVASVRRILRIRQVGHMGTLDPAAEGVLPIAVGRATRLINFVEGDRKEYQADLVLGLSTNTWDTSGTTECIADARNCTPQMVEESLSQFRGHTLQEPPMFSAIKVQGQKLVDLARRGETVARELRPVTIYSLELIHWRYEETLAIARLRVECSRGTYVRALCRDVGRVLGLPACMGQLTRTRSGRFGIADSVSLSSLGQCPTSHIVSIESLLRQFPHVNIDATAGTRFAYGQSVVLSGVPEGELAVFSESRCLGIGVGQNNLLVPKRVLAREETI